MTKFKITIHAVAKWNGKLKENLKDGFAVGEMCLYFDGGIASHKVNCSAEGPFFIKDVSYPYVWFKGVQNPND